MPSLITLVPGPFIALTGRAFNAFVISFKSDVIASRASTAGLIARTEDWAAT